MRAASGVFATLVTVVGAVVGVAVMVRTKEGRRTKVPFGPFMLVGTFLALFFGQRVIDWYVAGIGL